MGNILAIDYIAFAVARVVGAWLVGVAAACARWRRAQDACASTQWASA
jgi:hypothetical protein